MDAFTVNVPPAHKAPLVLNDVIENALVTVTDTLPERATEEHAGVFIFTKLIVDVGVTVSGPVVTVAVPTAFSVVVKVVPPLTLYDTTP
jgi:hypothetical protein